MGFGSREEGVSDVDDGKQCQERACDDGAFESFGHHCRDQGAHKECPQEAGAHDFEHRVLAVPQVEVAEARKEQGAERGFLGALELFAALLARQRRIIGGGETARAEVLPTAFLGRRRLEQAL